MSQTFFSKQSPEEKLSRLSLLGSSKSEVLIWIKGKKERSSYNTLKFDKERMEVVLDSREVLFAPGTKVLCTFSLRNMDFFSEVVYQISIDGHGVLQFTDTLFKTEKRSSYRLMTFPIYEVNAEFNLSEVYEGGKVVDIKNRSSQTGLFKSFLKLVETDEASDAALGSQLKIRVQDLSTTGMSIHVSELESQYFRKDFMFQNVNIIFKDLTIKIPEVKVVYVVDYISNDKNLKKFKIGLHFNNLPVTVDELIGKKINSLLRENDFNKDFENFLK
jgi:hypothetical protein